METTDRRPALRRALPSLVAAALPWTWFVVRDTASLLDVVATGLPAVVAGVAVLALAAFLLTRRPVFVVATGSVLAMGAVAVFGPWLPAGGPAPSEPIRVVGVNAYAGNVVVVEAPTGMDEALEPHFPHGELSPQSSHAVFSRFPVRFLSGLPGAPVDDRVSRWQVSAPSGPVVLYSVHLRRPRPRGAVRSPLLEQRAMVAALLRAVDGEASPTLVVGDFNLSDRTWAYRRLEGALRDAGRASPAGPTYVSTRYRPFLLRIDHVFVSRQWCAGGSGRFTITGSDHRGVSADVGPCRR
jgi:endonuclease/exonuclease/phosphatase family metal-dependent hydrolase